LLYYLLIGLGFVSIILNIVLENLSIFAAISLVFVFFGLKAGRILRKCYNEKEKLVESSKLTIAMHNFVSIVVVLAYLSEKATISYR